MTRLNNDQIAEKITGLSGWTNDGKTTLNSLKKVFKFKDFKEAFAFMTKVAALAEAADHHPEWSNAYNRVEIALTTHSAGGVSEKDIAMAHEIERAIAG